LDEVPAADQLAETGANGAFVVAIVAEAADVRAAELARALIERGHRVVVHTLPEEPTGHIGAVAEEMAVSWSQARPDVVHARRWASGLAVQAARVSLPGLPLPVDQAPEQFRLATALARSAERILATSSAQLEELVASGIRRNDIDPIPDGVDIELFSPAGPVFERGDAARLVTAGPMVEGSGFDTVIAALQHLAGAELLIAREPSAALLDGEVEAHRLTALARRYGVKDRVRLLGQIAHEQFPALLRSADVVVSVPSNDHGSAVVVDAMACGRAVVASAVGGLADAVVEGATGVLVPADDPMALARVLRGLLKDPVRLDGFGLAAAERARLRYAWSQVAAETERSYEKAVAGAGVRDRRPGRVT
jgi:glycosyltransferase involved in cell wall biosynthesis